MEMDMTIADEIIQIGVEQIERSTRISMDYKTLSKVHEVAQSMRETLGLRARLSCDWPSCSVLTDGSRSLEALIGAGWYHTEGPRRWRSTDYCPEHAKHFGGRQWARVEHDYWINTFAEGISLVEHAPGKFMLVFGGSGSGGPLAYSDDRGALEKMLESDESINIAFKKPPRLPQDQRRAGG